MTPNLSEQHAITHSKSALASALERQSSGARQFAGTRTLLFLEEPKYFSFGVRLALTGQVIDAVTNQLEHYMDLLSSRQKLVASNIANADTPGYKTKDIDFQFEFIGLAMDAQPNVVEPQGLAVKTDGNNVSMDREARLLSENALRFNVASTLMRSALKTINNAIQEGKAGA
jgi:flagellar basal-body rod protein FlgB